MFKRIYLTVSIKMNETQEVVHKMLNSSTSGVSNTLEQRFQAFYALKHSDTPQFTEAFMYSLLHNFEKDIGKTDTLKYASKVDDLVSEATEQMKQLHIESLQEQGLSPIEIQRNLLRANIRSQRRERTRKF